MKLDDPVDAKLNHIVSRLNEYTEEMRSQNYEAAHEAADAIGSEEGDGCSMCEHLASSLSAAVAHSMWFPDEEMQREIALEAADRADRHADVFRDHLNES